MLRATAGAPEPGGIDQEVGSRAHRLVAADVELETRRRPARQQRRVEREQRAGVLGVALQRQHEGMAVDDAGRRRQQRRAQFSAGSSARAASPDKDLEVGDAVGPAWARIDCSFSVSAGVVATISLPQLRCGTPCSPQ